MANLDPLTTAEERDVLAVVSADRRMKGVLSGRNAQVLLAPVSRSRGQPADSRHAVVGFYDYAMGRSVAAVVDLKSKDVVAVEESPVQLQLSTKEASEAERLARTHPAIKQLLVGRKLNPLTRLYFPAWAGRDDPPHRYAVVFARPSKHERRYAIVDLTDEVVVEVLTPDAIRSQ
jgi:Cu2+-containing amine oxidase